MTLQLLRFGLGWASACVPADWTEEQILDSLIEQTPADASWTLAKDDDGSGCEVRVTCAGDGRRVHVLCRWCP